MSKRSLALLLSILVCGCAAGPPMAEPGNGGAGQAVTLAPVREALGSYHDCLRENVKAYLKSRAKPKQVADTVAANCEPELSEYRFAVREIYARTLNPQLDGYADMVLAKPDVHANRVREKGKRATTDRVTAARALAKRRKTTASRTKHGHGGTEASE